MLLFGTFGAIILSDETNKQTNKQTNNKVTIFGCLLVTIILIGVAVITACAVNIKPAKAAGEPTATPTILDGATPEYTGTAQKIVTDLPAGMRYYITTEQIDPTTIDAGKIVPKGYTALDFIEGTGTQFIDTQYFPNENTGIRTKVNLCAFDSYSFVYGGASEAGGVEMFFSPYEDGNLFIYGVNSYRVPFVDSFWVPTIIEQHRNQLTFDVSGQVYSYTFNEQNFVSPNSLYLFYINRDRDAHWDRNGPQIHYCLIYDNDVLVRDLVPARNATNTLGMYDLVNDKFYTNQGDGDDFVAGDAVNTAIKDWEWLDSVDDKQNNVTLQANTKYYVYYYTPNTDTTTVTPLAVKEFYVNCTNHVYGEWTITTPATCTTDGVREHTCTGCGHTESETITALGHDYQGVPVAPTCGAQGYTEYTCTRCPDQYQDDFVAATGNHDWGEWTNTTEPTCTDGGTQQHTCNACGLTESEHTSATGHNYGTQIIDPTCTAAGYTEHACQNPGCTASYRDEPTAALGHEYKDTVHQPTCTESGYTTHQCQRCTHSYNDTYTAATGHTYGTWTTTEPATTDHPGEQQRTCEVCGALQTRTLPALAGTTTNGGEKDNSGPLLWGIIIGAIAVLAGCGGLAWLLIVLFKPKHPKAEVAAA